MDTKGAAAEAELTCVRCGYDLRGRALDEPCPECGLAGHRSALGAGRELWDCPPGWVGRVAVGTVVVFVAYVLWPAVAMAGRMLSDTREAAVIGLGLTLALLAVHAVGVVMITTREPGGRRTRGGLAARGVVWGLRACAVGGAVGVLLYWYVFPYWYGPYWGPSEWHEWVSTTMYALLLACPALTVWRLRWLTRRVGRPRVAEHAAIAGCGLSAAVGVLYWVGEAWSERPWYVLFVLGVGTVVACYFWCLGVMVLVARSLSAAAREAWREADAARAGAA